MPRLGSRLTPPAPQLPRLRIVSGFGGAYNNLNTGTQTNGTTQLSGTNAFSFTPPVSFRNMQMLFANTLTDTNGRPQTRNGNAVSLAVGMVGKYNSLIPLTFSCTGGAAISPGGWTAAWVSDDGVLWSEPFGNEYEAATPVLYRLHWSVPSGGKAPTQIKTGNYNADGALTGTNDVISGTTYKDGSDGTFTFAYNLAPAAAGAIVFGPSMIIGEHIGPTPVPTVIVTGDETVIGVRNGASAGQGYVIKALNAAGGFISWNAGQFGMKIADDVALNYLIPTLAQYADHVVIGEGGNDYSSGATVAAVQGAVLKMAQTYVGPHTKVWLCTIGPRTTSTDSWATTANQTLPTWETNRLTHNNWLRDTSPAGFVAQAQALIPYANMVGVIDPWTLIEANPAGVPLSSVLPASGQQLAGTGGVWAAGSLTTDGWNPTAAAETLMGPAIPLAKLTAN